MIRIITLLGLAFLLASCGDEPEKEAEAETTQTPDDLATAKADANAKIALAQALPDGGAEEAKYVDGAAYKKAVKKAKKAATQLTADLAAADVNKIKADTRNLDTLINTATSMPKKSTTLAEAKIKANNAITDANALDAATVVKGAGHDDVVLAITNIKKTGTTDAKSVGKLTADIAAADASTDAENIKVTALDAYTKVLTDEIDRINKLIADLATAKSEAQTEIGKAKALAIVASLDAEKVKRVVPGDYVTAVNNANKGDVNSNGALELEALIADDTATLESVQKMTRKLKKLITAVEAVETTLGKAKADTAIAGGAIFIATELHGAAKYNNANYDVAKAAFKGVIDQATTDVKAATDVPAVNNALLPLVQATTDFELAAAKVAATVGAITDATNLHNDVRYNDAKYNAAKATFKGVIDQATTDVNAATDTVGVATAINPLTQATIDFKTAADPLELADAKDAALEAAKDNGDHDVTIKAAQQLHNNKNDDGDFNDAGTKVDTKKAFKDAIDKAELARQAIIAANAFDGKNALGVDGLKEALETAMNELATAKGEFESKLK